MLPGLERGEQPGPLRDQDVALQPGLEGAARRGQRVRHSAFGPCDEFFEACVEGVDEFLFPAQFLVRSI
ncbi:hypothetical protein GCM10010357_04760 [Streptomyces luteireticuli]|uniref:Uncharacterized protein n=1 Tax=Streptomyces luteireticuli TaxID=173858 RepID=A0ABN0Y8H7_9ACTN